ncbi:MAG: hypothetical protein IPF98_20580 [Gemmatimonadetes bacterium]|nr:hypothetical protein [Gemmatimonadota bacterium]
MLLSVTTLPLLVAIFGAGLSPHSARSVASSVTSTVTGSVTSVVNGSTTYGPSQSVHIWRGEVAQMEVFGSVVATALGVDIFLADGATPAPLMVGSIVTRKPSSVVIRIDVAAVVTRASYVVRFRYPVAAGTPDQFTARVYDRGVITAISADIVGPKLGETVTVTVTGQNLGQAKLDLSQVGQSPFGYAIKSRSATAFSFTLKFNGVGATSISSHQFFDEDIGNSMGMLAAQFGGSSSRSLEVMPNPAIASMTPTATVGSGTVTISGSGLAPSGWTPKIRVDDASSSNPELSVTVVNGSTLQFQSGMTTNYRDLYLRYRQSSGAPGLVEVALPHQVLAQFQPLIARGGDVLFGTGPDDCGIAPPCPSGADSRVFGLKQGATHEIQGLWLQPAANTPVVVKHGGTTLNVTYTSHNRIRFTVPSGAAATSGPLTVQTGGGTGTSPRVAYFAPPATGLSLQKKDGPETGNYPYVAVTDGKLEPDRNYRVLGANLHVIPYNTTGEGGAMLAVAPVVQGSVGGAFTTYIGDGWTSFHLPPGQPLGSLTLTYKHWGGTSTVGTFQVVAPAAGVAAMEVSRAGTPWFSNGSVQGATADRTLQSGSSASVLVKVTPTSGGAMPPLTVTSSDPAVVVSGPNTFTPSSVAYDANTLYPTKPTVSVPLQVQPVATARNVTLTFKAGNHAGAIASVPITLVPVTLPKLKSVAFEPAELTGGTHAKARVVLSSAPPVTMSLPVSTKDAVQVPSSVSLSATETVIQVPTPTVTQPTPIGITVGSGADARTASLTLYPVVQVQSLVPATSPIPAGRVTVGTLTLDHAAWETIVVTLTSSNPALLSVPASVTLRQQDRTTTVPLTAAAGVSTVVSVNVELRIGPRVHVATIRVGPGR